MKKMQKGNTIVMAIVVIVAMAIASGVTYLAATRINLPVQKAEPVAQTQPVAPAPVAQAPVQPTDETVLMQKYQNEKFGYSVNYPNGWFSYASDSADVFLQPAKEEAGGIPGPHAGALEIKVTTTIANASLIKIVKDKYNKAGITFSQEASLIGGENGLRVMSTCEGMGCGVPEWFVLKNSYLYDFNSNLGYSVDFDRIVTSFKFIK